MLFSGTIFNKAYFRTEALGKAETKYKADESGCRIINIPYDEYISETEIPQGALICDLSEANSGAENARIIQSQIDIASAKMAGGTVVIPKGRYKTTSIELKNNTTLFVQMGAELVSVSCDENENSDIKLESGVVIADNASNITITGGGTINGSGESFTLEPECDYPLYALKSFNLYTRVIESRKRLRKGKPVRRSSVIHLKNSDNIKVYNIILKDSAGWTFNIENCKNAEIYDFIIDNHMHVANTDGIDISGSENVTIHHTFIATADDGIVLKAIENPINKVDIRDCIISSFANCFKIGTETQKDVSDVSIQNCYFFMPDGITGGYAGVAIETADGSDVSDVFVSDIEMDGVSSPLLIWAGNRMKFGKNKIGRIKNVTVKNISADNVELPSAINSCKDENGENCISNIKLENIKAKYRDTKESLSVLKKVPEHSLTDYPEITRVAHIYFRSHGMSRYWDLPCYGLFIRNADEVEIKDFECTPRTVNKRVKIHRI